MNLLIHTNRLKGGFFFIKVAILMCMVLTGNTLSYGNDKVNISVIENEQTHSMAKEVLREAYRRIGYDAVFTFLPAKRSLEMANSGKFDGDVARIKGTEREYPNLIQIPTPVISFKGVAFSKTIFRKIKTWRDLKDLRVGIIRGIRYSEIETKALSPYFAKDMTHLFRLLDEDKIQIAIAVLKAGKIEINRHYKNSCIHIIGDPLYNASLYHFVHKKNMHLVSKLDNALKEMETKGEASKIIEAVFQKQMSN